MSNDNPFSAPHDDTPLSTDGPGFIRSRVFRANAMSFVFFATGKMQRLRREAQKFINSEVGAANVVSIVEHVGFDYSVVVWFRTA